MQSLLELQRGLLILGCLASIICIVYTTQESHSSAVKNISFLLTKSYGNESPICNGSLESRIKRSASVNYQQQQFATVDLHVPTLATEKERSPRHNSYMTASSNIMEYNEDTRKFTSKNSVRPQTKKLVIPIHRRHSRWYNSSSNFPEWSTKQPDTTTAGNLWSSSNNDSFKLLHKSKKLSRTFSRRRLQLAVPVRMFVYKNGNTGENSNHKYWPIMGVRHSASTESPAVPRSVGKIYVPIRFNDDNMIVATSNTRDCIQCPKNFTLTPEYGKTLVQVPVPEISACPYLAFVPGRLNVAITSGPSPGSFVSEGEYHVEMIVWKRGGGFSYFCHYSFAVKAYSTAHCPPLPLSTTGNISCSNGTQWGSECHIVCKRNYIVAGHLVVKCGGTALNAIWSDEPPKCVLKKPIVEGERLGCIPLETPSSGTVICDRNVVDSQYIDGTICQYFCFPDYVAFSQTKNSSISICRNGLWLPKLEVSCTAQHCSKPLQPHHAVVKCSGSTVQHAHVREQTSLKSTYPNGTICKYRCEVGYVIPTSQLPLNVIVCATAEWNVSSIPDCKRAIPPTYHHDDCKNQTLFTEPGVSIDVIQPRFTTSSGQPLTPSCSLPATLLPGIFFNFCEATDPELRATSTCSYHIKIIERLTPQPHYKDCRDKIITANRRGIAMLKPTRFLVTRSESLPETIEAQCTYSNNIGIGSYINNCSATDSEFNTTAHCSFTVTIKGLSCPPLPNVSNGDIHCHPKPISSAVYPPRTICIFKCNSGFVIVSSQKKWKKWKCLSKQLRWNRSKVPKCRKAIVPKPLDKECKHKTFFLKGRKTIWPKKPKFKTAFEGAKLKVRCTLNRPLVAGSYINFCEAKDLEMRTSTSCTYNITVKAKDCRKLPEVPHSDLVCYPSDISFGYHVGVVCKYECHSGYVMPSSLLDQSMRKCIAFRNWNNSVLPSCVNKTTPKPSDSSCLDEVFETDNPLTIHWSVPNFISSTGKSISADCGYSNISDYGVHNISCSAYDSELRLSGSCNYEVIVRKPDRIEELERKDMFCVQLPKVTDGEWDCSASADDFGYLVGTVCTFICLPGHVIPLSLQEFSIIQCAESQNWNCTTLPSCIEAIAPSPTNSSCIDQVIVTENMHQIGWNVPLFMASTGVLLKVTCEPSNITGYGCHNISCSAYDSEINLNASCEFTVEVLEPNMANGESEGCQIPEHVPNSELKCNSNSTSNWPISSSCDYMCHDGYLIPVHLQHLSTIVCLPDLHWNSTETPSCEAVSYEFLHPDCPDQSVNTTNPSNITINVPEIMTSTNGSAIVSCTPEIIGLFGTFEILCEAHDPFFDISLSCTFLLTVNQIPIPSSDDLPTEPTITTADGELDFTVSLPNIPCDPLTSPTNGHLNCVTNDSGDFCDTSCDLGYHFPSAYFSLGSYLLVCNKSNGMWNFQTNFAITNIPDCLGELPTTSWQVWLKFNVSVGKCDDPHMSTTENEIQLSLLKLNENVCNISVDCSNLQYHCEKMEDRNLTALQVTWTVEAAFNPADYENDVEIVPNVETQIEMVLENTQRAITVEQELRDRLLDLGAWLQQDSYRQGKFILICQKRGFVLDQQSDKCVECPSGTQELRGQCKPCPANHYQDKTGQLSCTPCPAGMLSPRGSRSLLECKE